MRTTAPVWVCEYKDCGHVWLCGDKTVPPMQCGKCRRRHWHETTGEVVTSPKSEFQLPVEVGQTVLLHGTEMIVTSFTPEVMEQRFTEKPIRGMKTTVTAAIGLTPVQPVRKPKAPRQPKTHAMRPGEKRTYCYISNPTGGEFDMSGNRFFPREGEQPTCKVCLKSMAARAGKSVTTSPSPVPVVDVDSDSTKDGYCDHWRSEKNEAGESVKVRCTNRATKFLYDQQSWVGSTCDEDEVKVGDDWMGFTISRIEPIETPVTTSQPNLCDICETNPRSDKRKSGTCDECQERLEKYVKRSDAGRKAWKSRNKNQFTGMR